MKSEHAYRRTYEGACTTPDMLGADPFTAAFLAALWNPHVSDNYGNFAADPILLQAAALPYCPGEETWRMIAGALTFYESRGIIEITLEGRRRIGRLVNFDRWQPDTVRNRRPPASRRQGEQPSPECPPAVPHVSPDVPHVSPDVPHVSPTCPPPEPQNPRTPEDPVCVTREDPPATPSAPKTHTHTVSPSAQGTISPELRQMAVRLIGRKPTWAEEEILQSIASYPQSWLSHGFRIAAEKDKPFLVYVRKVVENFSVEGLPSTAQLPSRDAPAADEPAARDGPVPAAARTSALLAQHRDAEVTMAERSEKISLWLLGQEPTVRGELEAAARKSLPPGLSDRSPLFALAVQTAAAERMGLLPLDAPQPVAVDSS